MGTDEERMAQRRHVGRPVRRPPFGGLSWSEYYRVIDAVGRGEAVTDPRLARPALIYAHRMERFACHAFWLVPLYLVSVGLGYLGDDSVDRSLGRDLVTAAVVIGVGTRLWLRLPRVRESTERTRAIARPVEVAPPAATWGDRGP